MEKYKFVEDLTSDVLCEAFLLEEMSKEGGWCDVKLRFSRTSRL